MFIVVLNQKKYFDLVEKKMGKKHRVNQDADGFDIPDESLKC